jgi:hypothetical protein
VSVRATWLAWSLCAVSLLIMALTLLLILLGWSTPLPTEWYPWANQAIDIVGYIGAPILGGLVASWRPENPYGWLWLGFGLGLSLLSFGEAYAAYALVAEPGSLPAPRTVVILMETVGFVVAITLLPLLLLLFPNGRPPSRRWRFVAWTVVAVGAVLLLIGPFMADETSSPFENPLAIGGAAGRAILAIVDRGVYVVMGALVLSALSLVFRYRHSAAAERQQIKWFAYAAAVLLGDFVFVVLPAQAIAGPGAAFIFIIIGLMGIPVAIGIAILRYRLYDIDRIINRTLVYGSLTVTLALVYFGGVTATQALLRTLTDQQELPQLVIVASTLVIAAMFMPLRRRIQSFIDRSFYRRKYDAAKTLEGFSMKLRDETDLEALQGDLVGVVRETMQPAHVSLWLRPESAPKREEIS